MGNCFNLDFWSYKQAHPLVAHWVVVLIIVLHTMTLIWSTFTSNKEDNVIDYKGEINVKIIPLSL